MVVFSAFIAPLGLNDFLFQGSTAPAPDKAFQPISNRHGIKVDEQPKLPTAKPKLAEQFSLVNWVHRRRRQRLHNHSTTDEQPYLIGFCKTGFSVMKRQQPRPFEGYSLQLQFVTQAFLVSRGQQAWSKLPMHFARSSDDRCGKSIGFGISTTNIARRQVPSRTVPKCKEVVSIRCIVILSQPEHKPPHTFLHHCHIKIQKQRQFPAAKFKVRERLCAVHWHHSLYRFDFPDNHFGHEEVEPIATPKFYPFVNYWDRLLPSVCDTPQSKFVGHSLFVSSFGFPGPQCATHFDGCAYNLSGDFINLHSATLIGRLMKVKHNRSSHSLTDSARRKDSSNRREAMNAEKAMRSLLCVHRVSAVGKGFLVFPDPQSFKVLCLQLRKVSVLALYL